MDQETINIMLADDHPIVMDGFQRALEHQGFRVVSKVSDPAAIIETYELLKPQALVLDVLFGNGRSGLKILEQLLKKHPQARVIILSQTDRFETIRAAFRIGAFAYTTKDCEATELAKGIRLAVSGQKYCTEKIGATLAVGMVQPDDETQMLTSQEIEVMRLVAEGLTLEEIGQHFGTYKLWASRQVAKLREHFAVERNAELVRIAVKMGIVDA